MDQMISAQPGLIPQEKVNLTRARIWACAVFVDYYTGYVFVALMQELIDMHHRLFHLPYSIMF